MIPRNNRELALLFHQMSDCYRYLGSEERFRSIAYARVARNLQNMHEDIATHAASVKTLDAIGGIGESIAEKILEFLQTGRIAAFETLKKRVPFELLGLLEISGIGPATLRILHERLHINSREDLISALENNLLTSISGFGKTRIDNLRRALKLNNTDKRIPLEEAAGIAAEILPEVNKIPGVLHAAVAGSIRRKKSTIGDIDIVIISREKDRKKIADRLLRLPQCAKVLARGNTRVSLFLKNSGIQTDFRIMGEAEYGAAMLYFTGSREHVIRLRMIARELGLKINEYGVFSVGTGEKLAGETEEGIYRILHMKYIPPEQRTDTGEIEKARL